MDIFSEDTASIDKNENFIESSLITNTEEWEKDMSDILATNLNSIYQSMKIDNELESTVEYRPLSKIEKYRHCIVCKKRTLSHYIQTFTTVSPRREIWIDILGSKNNVIKEYLTTELVGNSRKFICYDHFDSSQFMDCFVSRSRILRRDANPEPYVPEEFTPNRHDVIRIPTSETRRASYLSNRKTRNAKDYKNLIFKETIGIPTHKLSSTDYVKWLINIRLLRRNKQKFELYEILFKTEL